MRRLPEKRCRSCGLTFPNTREYFASGAGSTITSTCLTCYTPSVGNRKLEPCQVCGQHAKLVGDPVPQLDVPPRMCRRCLLAVNLVSGIVNPDGIARWMEYLDWRLKYPKRER